MADLKPCPVFPECSCSYGPCRQCNEVLEQRRALSQPQAEPNTAANRLMGAANSGIPNNPVLADSATTADALGSLPVVAYRALIPQSRRGYANDYCFYMPESGMLKAHIAAGDEVIPLTDHAQATAELEKRDAEILRLHTIGTQHTDRLALYMEEVAALRNKLAGVDGLAKALEFVSNADLASQDSGNRGLALYEAGNVARKAIATYEAAQGEKEPVL